MKTKIYQTSLLALLVVASSVASAEVLDRADGIKIGERLTLRPYVSLSGTYDSNVASRGARGSSGSHEKGDFYWMISPTLWLHYNAETWSAILSGFYNYRQHFKGSNKYLNHHEYGEDFRWNWANTIGREKGWSLILGQSFHQITASDDYLTSDGNNYENDARQFQFSGAVQRRFNDYWHADINGGYYWLDYQNDKRDRYTLYGWDRWMIGGEIGYAPSRWIDIILSGSYQGYTQDNTSQSGYSGDSKGMTFQGGFASYMTDRISYRLLAGWSRFEYGDGLNTADGFVYTASGNWKIGETWNTMILGTSYYQPSERQYASHSRVDAISWGLAKVMVRGKLRATLDLRYQRSTHEYDLDGADYDYVLDVITGRIGLNYSLCRFLSAYTYAEYQKSMNDHASSRDNIYDYDRWRVSIGLTLSY